MNLLNFRHSNKLFRNGYKSQNREFCLGVQIIPEKEQLITYVSQK